MIHEAYMPVYMGSRFSLRTGVRAGPPEVVQEALADLKTILLSHMIFSVKVVGSYLKLITELSISCVFVFVFVFAFAIELSLEVVWGLIVTTLVSH